MDKEQIIEMLKSHMYQFREDGCTLSEFRGIRQFINYLDDMGFADEILALQEPDPFSIGGKMAILKNCDCPECQTRRRDNEQRTDS